MWEHLAPIAGAASFIFMILTGVVGMLLRNSMLEMRNEIAKITLDLTKAITALARELDDRIDSHRREFGETAAALRAKITEVEIWARDNFVRRDSFYKVTGDLSTDIKDMGASITTRLDRMEGKIDEKA